MVGNFIVDHTKYTYLEPLWPVLERHPNGISLKQAVKQSHLNEKQMLDTINLLAQEYNKCSQRLFNKGFITNLVQSMLNGEKTDQTLQDDMATSWIFDKVMLYDRINELHWTDMASEQEMMQEIIKKYKEHKGV